MSSTGCVDRTRTSWAAAAGRRCAIFISRHPCRHQFSNDRRRRCSKLWCESTTNPAPVLRIAASRGFSELARNVIRSSHGHSTPSLKISCESIQPFSRNFANKETNKDKERYKQTEIDRKQYPVPRCIGDGVINVRITRTATRSCRTQKRAVHVYSPGVAAARCSCCCVPAAVVPIRQCTD